MISAGLTKETRAKIYRRDGYRCALCDSDRYLQIHHYIKRSEGGSDHPHNLITLCSDCHALAHGTNLREWVDVNQATIEQAIVEYLEDMYLEDWYPFK